MAKNQSMYIATQLHLTYLGDKSSEGSFSLILDASMLAVTLAVNFVEESNSTSEVATANVPTVMAFAELWVLGLLSHWKQRRYLVSAWPIRPTLA